MLINITIFTVYFNDYDVLKNEWQKFGEDPPEDTRMSFQRDLSHLSVHARKPLTLNQQKLPYGCVSAKSGDYC